MKQRQFNRFRRGFTLIEMLVVILILSILAALIIPKLVGRADDAKVAAAKSDIASMSSAIEQYRLDNGSYPSSDDGLMALRVRPSNANNWKGPYLEKDVPNDPWGNQYVYQSPGPSGQDFLITTYGADGAPGGDGNNADITSDD